MGRLCHCLVNLLRQQLEVERTKPLGDLREISLELIENHHWIESEERILEVFVALADLLLYDGRIKGTYLLLDRAV